MSTHKKKIATYFGIILFTLAIFVSGDLTTKAAPTNPCDDICLSGTNNICTYMIGHGYCIGYPTW